MTLLDAETALHFNGRISREEAKSAKGMEWNGSPDCGALSVEMTMDGLGKPFAN